MLYPNVIFSFCKPKRNKIGYHLLEKRNKIGISHKNIRHDAKNLTIYLPRYSNAKKCGRFYKKRPHYKILV